MRYLFVLLGAGLLCVSTVQATTLQVPVPYPTISSALSSSIPGDTVLVAPGVYYENLTMVDGVVLVSESGAAATIIDGGGSGIVIKCSGLSSSTEIVGFTIQNGFAWGADPGGGGILISGGSPRIAENIIKDNLSAYDGGGVFCLNCSSIIEDNEFWENSSNVAANLDGGAVFLYGNCSGSIARNVFKNNSGHEGGALLVSQSAATLTISHNLFWSNTATWGGGVAIGNDASPTLEKNTFYDNAANVTGAALWIALGASPLISRNIFAGHETAAIACLDEGSLSLFCNDLWDNSMNYCDCSFDTASNLSEDPLFCMPSIGDFHLQPGSPCDYFCGRIGAYGTGCVPYYPPDHPQIVSVSESRLGPGQESVLIFCLVDSAGGKVFDEGSPASVSSLFGLGTVGSISELPDTAYQCSYTAGPTPGVDSICVYDVECEAEKYAWTVIEILGPEPEIVSVTDVPGDQGGRVTVRWLGSPLDVDPDTVITHYSVWRSLPEVSGTGQAVLPLVSAGDVRLGFSGPGYRVMPVGSQAYYWEWIGNVPAHYFEGYSYAAYTLMDSTCSNPGWHYFLVSAHTVDDFVFYDSEPDSGYSVDNLAPSPPEGIAGDYVYPPPGVRITWRSNLETDLSHYCVYKGSDEGFIPNEANLVGASEDTAFVDSAFDPNVDTYYKVSAVDVHGNESDFSLLRPDQITDAPGSPSVPKADYLEQNTPNPFNPVTVIRFATSKPGRVTLTVFDVAGRPVRWLVEGWRPARSYEVIWDGRDYRGNPAASGVYLYKLESPELVDTKKMVLLR
jgi:hypothetical protein